MVGIEICLRCLPCRFIHLVLASVARLTCRDLTASRIRRRQLAKTTVAAVEPSSPFPHDDVVEFVHVVKRANADAALQERPIGHLHVRMRQVVEEDFDGSCFHVTFQPHGVPLVVPRSKSFIAGQRQSRRFLDDHDLAAVWVGPGPQVRVIKVLVILVIEKDAAVAVVSGVFGTADSEGDVKAAEMKVFDQRHMSGTAHRRLVVTLASRDRHGLVAIVINDFPGCRVEYLPTGESRLEVLFKHDFGLAGGNRAEQAKRWQHDR